MTIEVDANKVRSYRQVLQRSKDENREIKIICRDHIVIQGHVEEVGQDYVGVYDIFRKPVLILLDKVVMIVDLSEHP